jgi:hypothetical protein
MENPVKNKYQKSEQKKYQAENIKKTLSGNAFQDYLFGRRKLLPEEPAETVQSNDYYCKSSSNIPPEFINGFH